ATPARLMIGCRDADLGGAHGKPLGDDLLCRLDLGELLESADHVRGSGAASAIGWADRHRAQIGFRSVISGPGARGRPRASRRFVGASLSWRWSPARPAPATPAAPAGTPRGAPSPLHRAGPS